MTLGIPPTRPETGYGYLEAGTRRDGAAAREVLRFVEKPPLADAERYVGLGNRLRGTRASSLFAIPLLLAEMERLCPDVLAAARAAHAARRTGDARAASPRPSARCPSISIDYAVMEKAARSAPSRPAAAGATSARGRRSSSSGAATDQTRVLAGPARSMTAGRGTSSWPADRPVRAPRPLGRRRRRLSRRRPRDERGASDAPPRERRRRACSEKGRA